MEEREEIFEFDELEAPEPITTRIWNGVKKHADTIGAIAAAVITLVGSCIFADASKRNCDDFLYTESDGEIYQVPVKKVHSTKRERTFLKKSL